MEICKTIRQLHQHLSNERDLGRSIGFVPTMGALHLGHLSLLERALDETSIAVSSIFVNPTQFNDARDLELYPRTPEKDLKLLEQTGCHYVFMPDSKEIYPRVEPLLDIDFGNLDKVMEGAYRPGHFKGVATVVDKLFRIVEPHCAYFGEKDFQQLAIIRLMAQQLNHRIRIVGCMTFREGDGLAMSSRNQLLTAEQRKAAPLIYQALKESVNWITHLSIDEVKQRVVEMINVNSLLKVQYFEIVDSGSLQPVSFYDASQSARGCIAILTDGPRLIDNIAY